MDGVVQAVYAVAEGFVFVDFDGDVCGVSGCFEADLGVGVFHGVGEDADAFEHEAFEFGAG
mgnify:CR=1 FL=1